MHSPSADDDILVKECRLGSGTYSKVYKATDTEGNKVAIKINLCESDLDFKCCIREVDINSSMKHPYIVSLREVREGNPFGSSELTSPLSSCSDLRVNTVHFVYPLAIGDMFDYIYSNDVSFEKLREFMTQMLLSVEYIHAMEIIHRDVKIDNFLLFQEGDSVVCKLADFGMAKQYVVNQQLTPGICVPYCRPPECSLIGRLYDYKVDIWSLGCVFCEMVNRCTPIPIVRVIGIPSVRVNSSLLESIYERVPGVSHTDILKDYPRANLRDCRPTIYSFVNLGEKRKEELTRNGAYEDFHSLIGHMFEYRPSKRYSARECLNHRFFDVEERVIMKTRADYPPRPRKEEKYVICSTNGREHAVKAARNIYSRRHRLLWYTHRILFHAVSMFDEILVKIDGYRKYLDSRQADIYFRMTVYVFIKYFFSLRRESVIQFSRMDTSIIMTSHEINEAIKFESYMISLLNYSIYKETLYDRMCKEGYTSEESARSALDFVLNGSHSGLTLTEAFEAWKRR